MPEPVLGTAPACSAIGRKQIGSAPHPHVYSQGGGWGGGAGSDDKLGWSRRYPGGGGCLR